MFTFPYSYSFLTHAPNNKSTLPIHFMYHVSGINQPPTSLINQICPTTISTTFLYVSCSCCFHRFFLRDYCITFSLQNLHLCNTQPRLTLLQPFYFLPQQQLSFSFFFYEPKALAIFLTNSAAFPKKVKLPFIERYIFLPKKWL